MTAKSPVHRQAAHSHGQSAAFVARQAAHNTVCHKGVVLQAVTCTGCHLAAFVVPDCSTIWHFPITEAEHSALAISMLCSSVYAWCLPASSCCLTFISKATHTRNKQSALPPGSDSSVSQMRTASGKGNSCVSSRVIQRKAKNCGSTCTVCTQTHRNNR